MQVVLQGLPEGGRLGPLCYPALPDTLVKALVDSSPIGAYEKWRSLSSQYQQAGVNVSHGVLCTPSSSYSLAPIIEKFLLENKGG